MSDSQTSAASPSTMVPDPFKHVKYSLGMVLGVDDFDQEFAYLSNRDQWLARDLIGYGTVCGLQVTIEAVDSKGPRVAVSPGVAVNPRGQLIRVTAAQCAYLNDWLTTHRDDVRRALTTALDSSLQLYVVLCYRACPTDPTPIPGEPCRDEADATVDSRLADDYTLELKFKAPDQSEEKALRDFVQWLSQITVVEGETSVSLDDFLTAIRDATYVLRSPPASPPGSPPDFMYGSPPTSFAINSGEMCGYLRAAFRVWVTELRPLWRGPSCDGSAPGEECVLLAELNLPVVEGQAGSIELHNLNEEHRPYLIHLRMLQEWLVCGRNGPPPGDDVTHEQEFGLDYSAGVSLSYSRADHTHGTPPLHGDVSPDPLLSSDGYWVTGLRGNPIDAETAPKDNDVLTFLSGQWTPRPVTLPDLDGDVTGSPTENTVEKIRGVNVVEAATEPDEGQILTVVSNEWTPVDLHGDIERDTSEPYEPGKYLVTGLRGDPIDAEAAPQNDDVLTFWNDQWTSAELHGDITRDTSNPDEPPGYYLVTGLHGKAIDETNDPDTNDVLTFLNGKWTPQPPTGGGPQASDSVVDELKFEQPSSHGTSTSYSRADHTHGTPTLNGDILYVDASATTKQVQVTGILSHAVEMSAAPDLKAAKPLVFDETRKTWFLGNPQGTATGDYVRYPSGLQKYYIVAAGIVRADGDIQADWSPGYNDLTVRLAAQGVLLVTFHGYVVPMIPNPDTPTHRYIVKAIPVYDRNFKGIQPIIYFLDYSGEGILLQVINASAPEPPIPDNTMSQLTFMIEISRYDIPVLPPPAPTPIIGTPALINLNTATAEELTALPGIGQALANRIVRARGRKGYAAVDDLLNITGISADKLRVIRPLVTLGHK